MEEENLVSGKASGKRKRQRNSALKSGCGYNGRIITAALRGGNANSVSPNPED